ncbi:MAG TPA: hypothetical protein PKV21_04440 [bacterium]|nr:hypothetical protein [bacterium]
MEHKQFKKEIVERTFLIYIILFSILFLITNHKIFPILILIFALSGAVFPKVPVYLYKFGNFIGELYTKLILSIIFCFLICPISFIKKLQKKKILEKNSFWEEIDFKIEKENFEKMG